MCVLTGVERRILGISRRFSIEGGMDGQTASRRKADEAKAFDPPFRRIKGSQPAANLVRI